MNFGRTYTFSLHVKCCYITENVVTLHYTTEDFNFWCARDPFGSLKKFVVCFFLKNVFNCVKYSGPC